MTSGLGGGVWSGSCPDRLAPGEIAIGAQFIGRGVGPRARLDAVA
jgi:hypothetical protein